MKPLSVCQISCGGGVRLCSAIRSALFTRGVSILSSIDQPTIFLENSSWKKSLGDYRSKSTPLILSLKNHHGYLMRVWKQNDVEIFSEFVKIVNNSDAIIDNMTAQQRITVRRGIKKNAKSFVVHQGIEFIKVDK